MTSLPVHTISPGNRVDSDEGASHRICRHRHDQGGWSADQATATVGVSNHDPA